MSSRQVCNELLLPHALPCHSIACIVHASLAVLTGVSALVGARTAVGGGGRLFGVDSFLFRAMDVNAGFLLYSIIMYTRHVHVVTPPFPFTLLHHAALLACWLASKVRARLLILVGGWAGEEVCCHVSPCQRDVLDDGSASWKGVGLTCQRIPNPTLYPALSSATPRAAADFPLHADV